MGVGGGWVTTCVVGLVTGVGVNTPCKHGLMLKGESAQPMFGLTSTTTTTAVSPAPRLNE